MNSNQPPALTEHEKQALIKELENRRAIMRIDSDKLWEFDWFADTAFEIALMALTTPAVSAQPVSQRYKLPDGFVSVPRALTAENGAKAALIGEFNLEYNLVCHECFGEGCDDCSGEGRWINSIPVDWTTIKEIWAKGIAHFEEATQEVE